MNSSINPMRGIFDEFYSIDKRVFFIFLCLITFLLLFIKKSFIESQIAAFEILEQRGEMGFYHLLNALQYFSIPIVYLYKFTVVAFILWIGCFMFGYKVFYSQLWQLVMFAEVIFFGAEILKIIWFIFIQTDPDIWDVRAFYPFSIINFFDYKEVGDAWHYPLKALNLFEVFYWGFLVYGVQFLSNKRKDISLYIVLSSYVLWFFLWLVFFILIYK